jgi:putative flippase GtrA
MRKLLEHPRFKTHFSQGWRFVVVGGTGAMIDLGTQRLLVLEGYSAYVATIVSTLIAASTVFALNKIFTFKSRGKVRQEGRRFAFVYGVSITTNILITSGLVWLGLHYTLGKMIAIAVGVVWNYCMSHKFVFLKKKAPQTEELPVF